MATRTVEVRGPADQAFVRLVRTATLSAASQAGFAVDPCDEWRIAADEACNALIRGGAIDLRVVFEDDSPLLTLTICGNDGTCVALDATTELVLTTMVDHLAVSDGRTIVLQKTVVSPPNHAGR